MSSISDDNGRQRTYQTRNASRSPVIRVHGYSHPVTHFPFLFWPHVVMSGAIEKPPRRAAAYSRGDECYLISLRRITPARLATPVPSRRKVPGSGTWVEPAPPGPTMRPPVGPVT